VWIPNKTTPTAVNATERANPEKLVKQVPVSALLPQHNATTTALTFKPTTYTAENAIHLAPTLAPVPTGSAPVLRGKLFATENAPTFKPAACTAEHAAPLVLEGKSAKQVLVFAPTDKPTVTASALTPQTTWSIVGLVMHSAPQMRLLAKIANATALPIHQYVPCSA
jgi:hypothetical protein